MELRTPKRKRVGPHIKPQPPLPILIESENKIPVESELWPLYIGNFTGDDVVVCDPEEMKCLYTMGFFGKGSYSRGYPSFGLSKQGVPPIIKERQWQRRKCWMDIMKQNVVSSLRPHLPDQSQSNTPENVKANVESGCGDSMDIDEYNKDESESPDDSKNCISKSDLNKAEIGDQQEIQNLNSNDKVLVLTDSDDEDVEKLIRDPRPHLEDEPIKTVVETLNLTLEEAFFLSYALGCLQVIDISGQPMTLKQLWKTFCEVKPDFIELYVAYHYFRAKGWVVKSGYKFGGDYLLYKQGPPFYHASYIILVEKVNSKLQRQNDSLTWTKLHGLNRLSEGSGKDIIICQIVFPDNLTPEELRTPKLLTKFQVNEVMIKRWISSHEREEKEHAQE